MCQPIPSAQKTIDDHIITIPTKLNDWYVNKAEPEMKNQLKDVMFSYLFLYNSADG